MLKESSDHKTSISIKTYEHLTFVLRYLFHYYPNEPYELFEELVKKSYENEQEPSIHSHEEGYLFAKRQLAILTVCREKN